MLIKSELDIAMIIRGYILQLIVPFTYILYYSFASIKLISREKSHSTWRELGRVLIS